MNGFLEVADAELMDVDGGVGWLVIGAICVVAVGLTVAVGVIGYKSAEGMVGAIQAQQSGDGTGGSGK